MIKYSDAMRYDGLVTKGRTEPIRITVLDEDGMDCETIAKISFANAFTVESLVNEMLAAVLAQDLGLPINEVYFIKISTEFIKSIPNPKLRERFAKSNKLCFGSRVAAYQWRTWNKDDKLNESQIDTALGILAFDGFIGNYDRRPCNSNLLVKGFDWRIIDHEMAFDFLLPVVGLKSPWIHESLEHLVNLDIDKGHIFSRQLSNKSKLNFKLIVTKWENITDDRLMLYSKLLPDDWKDCTKTFFKRIERIRNIRDNIEGCVVELKRVLKHV